MTAESLPSDKANRIADAIESLERNVTALREKRSIPRTEYTEPDNQDLRDSVERKFEKLAEAMLDVADQILTHERGESPDRRRAMIRGLHREGVLDAGLTEEILDAIAFKEVLSHTYGPIINDDLVYDALQEGFEQYVDFAGAIDQYLQE